MATLESPRLSCNGAYRPARDLCLLTFDDGLKEHYRDVTPLLAECRVQGLFFVISGCVEERTAGACTHEPLPDGRPRTSSLTGASFLSRVEGARPAPPPKWAPGMGRPRRPPIRGTRPKSRPSSTCSISCSTPPCATRLCAGCSRSSSDRSAQFARGAVRHAGRKRAGCKPAGMVIGGPFAPPPAALQPQPGRCLRCDLALCRALLAQTPRAAAVLAVQLSLRQGLVL